MSGEDISLAKLLEDMKGGKPLFDTAPVVTVTKPVADETETTLVHLGEDAPASQVTIKNIFRHPAAQPVVLDYLLIKQYGVDWLGWEIETIEHLVPIDFGIDRISDLNVSKIQAMKTLHLVDSFWQQWEVFTWCAMPLNSTFPDFRVMQVPDVLQCMIAVDTANRVRDDMAWGDEVKNYLAMVFRNDGVAVPIPPLSFVEVDSSDYPIDAGFIFDRWPEIRAARKAPVGNTVEDEQLRRMLALFLELEKFRAQRKAQMEIIGHV